VRTLLVAGNDLRRRIRNRSALVTAFVGPLAMAIVFSLLIGGADSARFRIGVVDADGSPVSRELTAGALGGHADGAVTVVRSRGETAARRAIDDDGLDAAIVVPAGFGDGVERGEPATITVLRSPDRLVSGQVAEAIAAGLVAHVERVGLAMRVAAARTGRAPDPSLGDAAHDVPAALALKDVPPGGHEASPGAFYGAAMSILFLFFTVGYAARSVLAERRDGTLGRVLATPISPAAVVAGKTLSVAAIGLAGFFTVWGVTALAFDARWGDPLAVAVVIVATVLAVGGVSTLVTSLARTDQQADAYTAVATFVLALLGGNFVGPGASPELLRQLSLLTPNGWALSAFTDLSADAASLTSVLGAVAVLAAVAAVTGAVGLRRIHRLVAR
jgi:ABC-2 type transport system permease protein